MQYLDEFLQRYPDIRVQLITTTPGQLPELHLDLFISRELSSSIRLASKPLPYLSIKRRFMPLRAIWLNMAFHKRYRS